MKTASKIKKTNYTDNKALENICLTIRKNFNNEHRVLDKSIKCSEKEREDYNLFRYNENGNETPEFIRFTRLKNEWGKEIDKIYHNYCKKPSFINYTYTASEGYILFIYTMYRYFFKKYKFGSKVNYDLENFNVGDYIYVSIFDSYCFDKDEIGVDYEYNKEIQDVIVHGQIEKIVDNIFTINGKDYNMEELSYTQHDDENPLFEVTYDETVLLTNNSNKESFVKKYGNNKDGKMFTGETQLNEVKDIVVEQLKKHNNGKSFNNIIQKIESYKKITELKKYVQKHFPEIYHLIEDISVDKNDLIKDVCKSIVENNKHITDCYYDNDKVYFSFRYILNSTPERDPHKPDKQTRLEKMLEFLGKNKNIRNISVDEIYYIHNNELYFKKHGNPFSYITMYANTSIVNEIKNTNKVRKSSLLFNGLAEYDVDIKNQHKFREFDSKYICDDDKNKDAYDNSNMEINKGLLED